MTAKITLGGQEFFLPQVTIGRLEALQNALTADANSAVARSVAVINAALAPGSVDAATPATLAELTQAMKDSLAHAGFRMAEKDPAGND